MPRPPLPPQIDAFLARPNPAVVATLRPDGGPHTAATWYIWDGRRVLLNMDASRRRLEHLRRDGRVALTALDPDDPGVQVSLMGAVVSLAPDPDLADIDRLSRHYTGEPYSRRDRSRWSAWMDVERWHAWRGGGAWRA